MRIRADVEVIEAAQACFIKGDATLVGRRATAALTEAMRGKKVGRLGESAGQSPLVLDFHRRLRELRLPVEHGRLFTQDEVDRQARVIVLGYGVAKLLFDGVSPLGKQMRVANQPFLVIGVLKEQGAMPFANRDDEVTVPITTAMRRLFRADRDRIRGMSVQAISPARMKDAEEEVLQILARAAYSPVSTRSTCGYVR